jgi:hypothetical protein
MMVNQIIVKSIISKLRLILKSCYISQVQVLEDSVLALVTQFNIMQ